MTNKINPLNYLFDNMPGHPGLGQTGDREFDLNLTRCIKEITDRIGAAALNHMAPSTDKGYRSKKDCLIFKLCEFKKLPKHANYLTITRNPDTGELRASFDTWNSFTDYWVTYINELLPSLTDLRTSYRRKLKEKNYRAASHLTQVDN